MTMPELKQATVTLKDGTTLSGLVLQDHLSTQVHPVPHDPEVESPKWFANTDIEKVEYEGQ